jgi:hypothetical protein
MHGALAGPRRFEDVLGPSNSRIVIEDSADTGWAPRWLEVLQEHEVIVASRHVCCSTMYQASSMVSLLAIRMIKTSLVSILFPV